MFISVVLNKQRYLQYCLVVFFKRSFCLPIYTTGTFIQNNKTSQKIYSGLAWLVVAQSRMTELATERQILGIRWQQQHHNNTVHTVHITTSLPSFTHIHVFWFCIHPPPHPHPHFLLFFRLCSLFASFFLFFTSTLPNFLSLFFFLIAKSLPFLFPSFSPFYSLLSSIPFSSLLFSFRYILLLSSPFLTSCPLFLLSPFFLLPFFPSSQLLLLSSPFLSSCPLFLLSPFFLLPFFPFSQILLLSSPFLFSLSPSPSVSLLSALFSLTLPTFTHLFFLPCLCSSTLRAPLT